MTTASEPATLFDIRRGRDATVTTVGGNPGVVRRLAELGLRRGTAVRVLSRNAGGGATLALGTGRIALDRAVLRDIAVLPAT